MAGPMLVVGVLAACGSGDARVSGSPVGTTRLTVSTSTTVEGIEGATTDPLAPEISAPKPLPSPATNDGAPVGTSGSGAGDPIPPSEPEGATVPDERAALPASPPELASALAEAEQAIRQPDLALEARASWGRHQQRLYRVLSAHPDWAEEVLATIDPSISQAVSLNWSARQALNALLDTETPRPTLPAWRIDEPRPAEELLAYYHEAADATGVPWTVLAAINLVETRMGRINGVSTAGAIGPMQFLPTTWAECCEGDPTDAHDAIRGAADYLLDRGAATDLDRAIFGYNNSDHYVTAVQSYAGVLALDEGAYHGYHAWEVYYRSSAGLVHLPAGYLQPEPTDAAAWIQAHPDELVSTEG